MNMMVLKIFNGEYQEAQIYAREVQRYARLSAELYIEATALRFEALASYHLGDYKNSLPLLHRARSLLGLCGLTGSKQDTEIQTIEAGIWFDKSEYPKARSHHVHQLDEFSIEQYPYIHACELRCMAHVDLVIGASPSDVHKNLDKAKAIYSTSTVHYSVDLALCQIVLELREKNYMIAKTLLEHI